VLQNQNPSPRKIRRGKCEVRGILGVRKFCKDICTFYKARKTKRSACYYNQGFKRCIECEIFMECAGIRCPCCDRILRIKPHNNISKGKLLQGLPLEIPCQRMVAKIVSVPNNIQQFRLSL
jgi:hypothetical protein